MPHECPEGGAVVEEFEGQSWGESLGARRADALCLLAETYLAHGAEHIDTSADRYQVVVHIDQALLAAGLDEAMGHGATVPPLDRPSAPLRGAVRAAASAERDRGSLPLFGRCELEAGPALALETAQRLGCCAALVGIVEDADGEPLSVGRKTRAIPPAIARALRARDGGCRFPGCGRRFTEGHHIVPWAKGGETKLSNLISLCRFHHHLVHEGRFSIEIADDGAFVFRGPDGRRLPESGRLDRRTLEALAEAAARGGLTLRELNRREGLSIDADTARCQWTGERMDYHFAVGLLCDRSDEARRRAAGSTTAQRPN